MHRGRESPLEAMPVATLLPAQRPEPLGWLTEEQKDYWRTTVNRYPPDWFTPETWPMLAQLCRHVATSRFLAGKLNQYNKDSFEDERGLARFERITKLFEREGRAIASLMTRMRMTHQSRWHQTKAHAKVADTPVRKPWEEESKA